MKVKLSAIGNIRESYIEDSYTDNVNIICSNDNNKGKSIVIQSLLYALGNAPIFPSGFNYKEFYHYVEFESNGVLYAVCRKSDTFFIREDNVVFFPKSIAEFKSYFHDKVFRFPYIYKNRKLDIVDPSLFLQLFSIGQDQNVSVKCSKEDFFNIIYGWKGVSVEEDLELKKSKIQTEIKDSKKTKNAYWKIYKASVDTSTMQFMANSSEIDESNKDFQKLDELFDQLGKLDVEKNELYIDIKYLEKLKNELVSINKNTKYGNFVCRDCHSTKIDYIFDRNDKYTFDVSTPEMRERIISSLDESIQSKRSVLELLNANIKEIQSSINGLLEKKNLSVEFLLLHKKELFESRDIKAKIDDLDNKVKNLEAEFAIVDEKIKSNNALKSQINTEISEAIKQCYEAFMLPESIWVRDLLPSKKDVPSGSDLTIFSFIRLIALTKVLSHWFPIIIDSFRGSDLSSNNESHFIHFLANIPNQVILTTTLKTEEADTDKYENIDGVNKIDYSFHQTRKLLSEEYNNTFSQLLLTLNIDLNISNRVL